MNILFLQLKRIGDLILTVPAIAAVRARFPDARITLVVSKGCRDLLPAIPGIDRMLIAHGDARDLRLFARLAASRFDYAIDFTRNDRSALLTFLSTAKHRITSDRVKLRSRFRSLSYNEFVDSPTRLSHTIDYHLAFLSPLGIERASSSLHLKLPPVAQEAAERVLTSAKVSKPIVLFHPGSARVEKFWEPERWAGLIDYCHREVGVDCVLTAGSSPLEASHVAAVKSHAREPFADLSGKVDLLTLAALIERARLLVTVDSAPMHLAAALGTSQVVLFGPTNPFHWRPLTTPAVIIQAGQATPLTEFSPDQPSAPMNLISTQQVIDAMKSMLSAPAASPL